LDDQPIFIFREENSRGRKMVSILSAVFGWPSEIKEEVARHPSNSQHEHNAVELSEGSLTEHLVGKISSSVRNKDLVILTRTSVVVMMTMRNPPGMVGDKEK
jgi:hypothetical protein